MSLFFFLFLSKKRNLGRIFFTFIHSLINSNRKLVSGEVRNLLFSVVNWFNSRRHYNILHFFLVNKSCLDLTIKVCCDVASQESDFRYCAFQKHPNSEVQKPTEVRVCVFRCRQSSGLWFALGEFRSVLCVSLFQGSLLLHDRNDNWR